jgi:hypothetical protein
VSAEDPRLARLTAICASLPETTHEFVNTHATFRVRKKVFAYYLDDHHGDGIVAVAFRMPAGGNEALARSQPERFYLPAYIGKQGWAALRLDRGEVDWDEVTGFVTESYAMQAPKSLASRL